MLRVTVVNESSRTVLKLEGKLAGPWVAEVERCWNSVLACDQLPKTVDVRGVSFVSAAGKDLLQRLHHEGAILVGEGLLTVPLVEEITSS